MTPSISKHGKQCKQLAYCHYLPSVLWCCWLGDRKDSRPVKTEWWGAGVVVCLKQGADLHTAELMPLPLTVSCFSEIQTCFTSLVPAHPGSPRKGPLNVCVLLSWQATYSLSRPWWSASRWHLRGNPSAPPGTASPPGSPRTSASSIYAHTHTPVDLQWPPPTTDVSSHGAMNICVLPTVTYLSYCISGSTLTTVGCSQLPTWWPGTHSRILSGIQRAAQTVLAVYLKHSCLCDTSASSTSCGSQR